MKKLLACLLSLGLAATSFAARPIARWDVVPYQRVAETFKIGVVAFHEAGVKVTFTVNGRKAYIAKKATRNNRTGVTEFVFPFDPAKYPDGLVTIGAKAETEGIGSYELPELPLYANSKQTLGSKNEVWVDSVNGNDYDVGTLEAPLKTLKRGVFKAGPGGTVNLKAGKYELKMVGGGKERKYWTLVRPAEGVERKMIEISGGRSGTEKLHLKGLDLYADVKEGENLALVVGEGGETMAWFEDCSFTNKKGRGSGVSKVFGNRLRAFVTGGRTHDMTYGPACELLRGHEIKSIATEAFSGGECLVVNVKVNDVDPAGTEVGDADLYQGFAPAPEWVENVIFYNVSALDCKCRAFAGRQIRNAAFVNIAFKNTGDPKIQTRFSEGLENVIFARIRMVGQDWWWMNSESGRDDVRPKDVRLLDVKGPTFTGHTRHEGISGAVVCDIISFPR